MVLHSFTKRLIIVLISSFLVTSIHPQTRKFAILHTNDIQSRLLGYGPNSEYSPDVINNDDTVGGVARLTTKINERRWHLEQSGYEVLVLDGGDLTMGTLFHTVARSTGGEYRLLANAGYDAAGIGNHEFDFAAAGLVDMINSALKHTDRLPVLLLSNIAFSSESRDDDSLEDLFNRKVIKPYHVFEKNGIRFGVFALIGYDAWEVTAKQEPLTHIDPVEKAKELTKYLREKENADVIILCSHGGVAESIYSEFTGEGEDILIAEKVPGIDVVVGGHSHTPIFEPKLVNGQTVVMQAGSESKYLGELKMTIAADQRPKFKDYKLHLIDDSIAGDQAATKIIEELKEQVNRTFLSKYSLRFDTPLVEISQDFKKSATENLLGNFMADSARIQSGADIGISSEGTIRDSLLKGKHGIQWVSDVFRLAPLGEGEYNRESGYPLVKLYSTAREVRNILEVLTFAYRSKGLSYFPRFSGLRYRYNAWRLPLDSVYQIELLNSKGEYEAIDFSADNKELYSIGTTIYIARFLPLIEELSKGILKVVPKDAKGNKLEDLRAALIDDDPNKEGVQELMEWLALFRYTGQFSDTDNNGIVNLPATGKINEQRMIRTAGFSNLFTGAGLTYVYIPILILILLILWFVIRKIKRRLRNR